MRRFFALWFALLLVAAPFRSAGAAEATAGLTGLAGRLRDGSIASADGGVEAVVTPAIGANVRNAPWGTKLTALVRGTRVTVTGRSGEFYAVALDGRTVYIHVNCLRLVGATPVRIGDGSAAGTTPAPVSTGSSAVGGRATDAGSLSGSGTVEATIGSPSATEPAGTSTAAAGETGSAFLARTAGMSRAEREKEIERALLAGDMPSFLKRLRSVTVKVRLADGLEHTAVYRVAPDYLAIGTDDDFVRMPMSPITAQKVADALGCVLPTARMVDQIYAAADVKLSPNPMSDGRYADWQNKMMTNAFTAEHQRLVERQLAAAGAAAGDFVAGQKKDVVITNRLDANPGKVAIYGWHQKNGKAIQGLSTVHESTYADYSHGVRLVAGTMTVDGREMKTADVLADPVLSGLISGEGAIRDARAVR